MDPRPLTAALQMSVMKNGRTTALTLGRITGLNASLPVNYGSRFNPRYARFRGQIEIRGPFGSFSSGGDSGSIIVHEQSRRPVALLFAGDGIRTWANPIEDVIRDLGIDQLLDREI